MRVISKGWPMTIGVRIGTSILKYLARIMRTTRRVEIANMPKEGALNFMGEPLGQKRSVKANPVAMNGQKRQGRHLRTFPPHGPARSGSERRIAGGGRSRRIA